MRTVSRWSFIGLIQLFCIASAFCIVGDVCIVGDACAQWTNVAQTLISGAGSFGAMQFKDAVVWAGANTLWSSPDSGKTWHQSKTFPNAEISDLAFYDKLHGLVVTIDQGLFVTMDGGNTWTNELVGDNLVKVGYGLSNSILFALEDDGLFYTSIDGGANWTPYALGNGLYHSFAVAQNGTIYTTGFLSDYIGNVEISTNLGQNWNPTAGNYNGDCWTLAVDSCDPERLYLANEEWQVTDSLNSYFYLSTDGGQSWQSTDGGAKPYLSGTLSTTTDGIFLGTENGSGVHRSMDRGLTWKSIGGPSVSPDTRNIALVNDNIILATDEQGSIWQTINGGGDSVQSAATGGLALTPAQLFTADSTLCTSISRTIQIVRGCGSPTLDTTFISGPDSMSYQIGSIANDSFTVTLTPQSVGTQSAWLVGRLDNGTSDTVFLAGVGVAAHTLTLAASSKAQPEDTIGGTVNVPIAIGGLVQPETVEMVLHYPLPDLQYVGSFDPSGTQVDVPGQQWPGRSLLKILNVQPGSVAANARFNVFSDTDYDPVVTFDSVDVLSAASACEYTLPPAVTDTIIPLEGCGVQMLSQWMHLGVEPLFSIIPNPTGGLIQLTSTATLGNVWVNIYDMLGNERGEFPVSIEKNVPVTLTLPFESGLYLLHVGSMSDHPADGQADLHVLIEK